MKVTKEHQDILRQYIAPLDNERNRTAYRNGDYHNSDRTVDVNKRYRWDLMWAAKNYSPDGFQGILYADYNDAHLDTALRSIVKEL